MELSPEMQASIRRYQKALENAILNIDVSVTPEVREQLQVEFEKFKRQLSDSDYLKMILKIEAISPRTNSDD